MGVFPCIQFNSNFYLIKFTSYYTVSTSVLEKIWGLTIVIILISRILPPISIHIAGWVVFPYVQTVPVSIHIAWDLSICNILCKYVCIYFWAVLCFGPGYDVKLSIFFLLRSCCISGRYPPFCFFFFSSESLL